MKLFLFLLTIIYFAFAYSDKNKQTVLSTEKDKKEGCLLFFYNSTSVVERVTFNGKSGEHALSISENSHLSVEKCRIVVDGSSYIPFVCSGYISMNGIKLIGKENGEVSIPTLCLNDENNHAKTGHFVISGSRFNNCVMSSHKGTFVSSGAAEEQIVKNCEFLNISIKKGAKESENIPDAQVMSCLINNVKIKDSQDSFYGVIVSGLTSKTLAEFSCFGCEFENINRESLYNNNNNNNMIPLKETPNEKDANRHRSRSNSILGRYIEDNKKRQVLLDKVDSFKKTTFKKCKATSLTDPEKMSGGAIIALCASEQCFEKTMSINDCKFEKCQSSSHGGACSFFYMGRLKITKCTFEDCKTISNYAGLGGGIYINDTLICLSINNCLFKKCQGKNGGGIELYSDDDTIPSCSDENNYTVIYACKFDGCVANFSSSGTCYGGGGDLEFRSNQCISDCIFKNCRSEDYGGGLYLHRGHAEKGLINLCYFENNVAKSGGDDIYLSYYTFVDIPISSDTFTNEVKKNGCYDEDERSTCNEWLVKGDNKVPNHSFGGKGGLEWWAIFLIVLAIVIVIAVVVVVIVIVVIKKKKSGGESSSKGKEENME